MYAKKCSLGVKQQYITHLLKDAKNIYFRMGCTLQLKAMLRSIPLISVKNKNQSLASVDIELCLLQCIIDINKLPITSLHGNNMDAQNPIDLIRSKSIALSCTSSIKCNAFLKRTMESKTVCNLSIHFLYVSKYVCLQR